MMIGTILLNIICGLLGFAFTFLISLQNNLILTSLYKGIFGFILWFLLAFALRWVLGFITNDSASQGGFSTSGGDSESLGGAVDLSTPDEEEELKDLLKPKPAAADQGSGDFKPLQPPKLVSMKDPEELAKAVRHLKEEE